MTSTTYLLYGKNIVCTLFLSGVILLFNSYKNASLAQNSTSPIDSQNNSNPNRVRFLKSKMKFMIYERGKKAIMPNGDIVEIDGSITKKNGMKVQPIMENGECIGAKFFRPDGTEIKKGETFVSNDGRTFKH